MEARGRIQPSGGFCLLLAVLILLFPLPWIMASLLAAGFHELCHSTAVYICTGQKIPIKLYVLGAQMPLPAMSRKQELLCTLAGPLGGLLLLLFAPWLPRTAICAGLQSIYNLLPIYPLDGGRAISCLLEMLLPPPAAKSVEKTTENLCIACLLLLGLWGYLVKKLGPLPLLMALFLLLRIKFLKMPCKVSSEGVQ